MVRVKKLFGELSEAVAVLSEMVEFDVEGNGEASEEAAEVLAQIPGYEVEGRQSTGGVNPPVGMTSEQVTDKIVSEAGIEAEKIVFEARAVAETITSEAESEAKDILSKATTEAEGIIAEARAEAEKIVSEAQKTATAPKRAAPQTK